MQERDKQPTGKKYLENIGEILELWMQESMLGIKRVAREEAKVKSMGRKITAANFYLILCSKLIL